MLVPKTRLSASSGSKTAWSFYNLSSYGTGLWWTDGRMVLPVLARQKCYRQDGYFYYTGFFSWLLLQTNSSRPGRKAHRPQLRVLYTIPVLWWWHRALSTTVRELVRNKASRCRRYHEFSCCCMRRNPLDSLHGLKTTIFRTSCARRFSVLFPLAHFIPPLGQTRRQKHNVVDMYVRPSVRPSVRSSVRLL